MSIELIVDILVGIVTCGLSLFAFDYLFKYLTQFFGKRYFIVFYRTSTDVIGQTTIIVNSKGYLNLKQALDIVNKNLGLVNEVVLTNIIEINKSEYVTYIYKPEETKLWANCSYKEIIANLNNAISQIVPKK